MLGLRCEFLALRRTHRQADAEMALACPVAEEHRDLRKRVDEIKAWVVEQREASACGTSRRPRPETVFEEASDLVEAVRARLDGAPTADLSGAASEQGRQRAPTGRLRSIALRRAKGKKAQSLRAGTIEEVRQWHLSRSGEVVSARAIDRAWKAVRRWNREAGVGDVDLSNRAISIEDEIAKLSTC